MFVHGRGTLYDWLKRNERDMADCGLGSPIAHLARTGMLGERLIAVHANTLARGDAALLGQSGTRWLIARAAMNRAPALSMATAGQGRG